MKKFFEKHKHAFGKAAKGAISILLSIVLLNLFSLGALVMESGRYQSAKAQLNEANLSAAVSMLANFNETLQESYGIYAFSDKDVNLEEYSKYLNFNSDLNKDYYGNNLSRLYGTPTAEIDTMYNLTDPYILKRQIMEYSKYNIPLGVAAELLDVEEMMKKLKKEIKKAIPGLDEFLKVCDAIEELATAIENLYQLEKAISDIDRCYDGSTGLMAYVQKIENYLTNVETVTYDPAYVKAYDEFVSAVQNKVDYMKKKDAPKNPGDNPPNSESKMQNLSSAKNTARKNLTTKSLKILVDTYGKTEVFGGKTKVTVSGDAKKAIDIMSGVLDNIPNISGDTAKIRSIIETIAKENYGYSIKKWDSNTLSTLNSKISGVSSESIDSLNGKYVSAKSNYDIADEQNDTWEEKKKEYDEYQEKLRKFDKAITEKGNIYKKRCNDLSKLLGKYKSYLDKATGSIKDASDAVKKANGDKEGVNSKQFKELQKYVDGALDQATNVAMTWLSGDASKIETLLGDLSKIDKKYSVSSNFTKRVISPYYMSGAEALAFVAGFNAIKVIDETITKATLIFQNIKDLVDLFSAIPYIANLEYNVTLSTSTINLLPSKTGTISSGGDYSEDITALSGMLSEAQTMLGASYTSDINKVDPLTRLEEADIAGEIDERLDETIESIKFFCGECNVLSPAAVLVTMVFKLEKMIGHAKSLYENMVYFINHFDQTIDAIIRGLYENTLMNFYIVDKFPNRIDTSGKSYKGYDGLLGIFPEGDTTAYKAACVEYILQGDYNEILAQNGVFWKIFLLRMINNIVCVAADPEVMDIIASCNIFALIVFPLWVYLETNFDMNVLLMDDGGKVPFIKTKLFLSPKALETLGEKLGNVLDDIEMAEGKIDDKTYEGLTNRLDLAMEEFTAEHGFAQFSYEDYLWLFLFFTSNRTKTMRIADLIQMHMRYQQVYGEKATGSATFLMSEMNTFIRVNAVANFNSIIPIISIKEGGINGAGIKVRSTKYVGY